MWLTMNIYNVDYQDLTIFLQAHRIVLSSCSPYFRAMFTSNLAESKQDKVSLYDVDAGAIEALIDYAYSNKVMFCCYIILLMCY